MSDGHMQQTIPPLVDNLVTTKYKGEVKSILRFIMPNLSESDLDEGISYSIQKRYKEEPCKLYNNYTERTAKSTLMDMTNYILQREPICTSWGVLFKKHGEVPNPLAKMIDQFMKNRAIHKKEMFKYAKYSDEWEKYNLFQLLDKTDCNSIYGILGLFSSVFYNLHVAASITATGQSCVSAMGMFFESFLSNNVKFGSLNEVLRFIDKVNKEHRVYNDLDILDESITREECFYKICMSIGWEWMPDEEDLELIRKTIWMLDSETINRLYYKNNLYSFIENKRVFARINNILKKLKTPFMNPNKPPKEVQEELNELCELMKEYVYFGYQIIDKVDRMRNMPRNVSLILDTDSNLVSLDAWYRCVLDKIWGEEYNILKFEGNLVEMAEADEYGEYCTTEPLCTMDTPYVDYDFFDDETIDIYRSCNLCKLTAQDSLRYSIINIISYILSQLILDYMLKYTQNNYSYSKDRECMMIAKNEFLFRNVLMTLCKKNYASIQELQEGNFLGSVLDIKGLPIDKSSMNETTRKRLKEILYEDILKVDTVDQIHVLKQMAKFEREIHQSLAKGEKNFYKPMSAKPLSVYPDPMRVVQAKAEIVWNEICGNLPALDEHEKNAMDVVKVDINPDNVTWLKDRYPDVYERVSKIVPSNKDDIKKGNLTAKQKAFKCEITSIGIPKNIDTPEWILNYINYKAIINDNLKNMPLDSIGLERNENSNVNLTNILKIS